jgi:hypothetical protein
MDSAGRTGFHARGNEPFPRLRDDLQGQSAGETGIFGFVISVQLIEHGLEISPIVPAAEVSYSISFFEHADNNRISMMKNFPVVFIGEKLIKERTAMVSFKYTNNSIPQGR